MKGRRDMKAAPATNGMGSAEMRAHTNRSAGAEEQAHADGAAFAGALADAGGAQRYASELRRQVRRLLIPVVLTAGLLATWSAVAPLAGAIVAPAQVRAEFKRKTVQHQEGGIVREIFVRDGQAVHAGDPLLVVGDVRREADLNALRDQWLAARMRAARADAEGRSAARFDPPEALLRDGATAEHVARERALFDARRRTLDEQDVLLQIQIRQSQAQASALGSQIEAIHASAALSDEELAINERLVEQGFVSRARVLALQRTVHDYRSRIGEARGDQASALQRVSELRARLSQLQLTYRMQAADEAKEAALRVRELDERVRAAADQVERQIVRAPVDGEAMGLRVAAVGDVIGPREPLLDIVPSRERLVVDARIEPRDIEHVRVGGAAEVRVLSADARTAPLLPARITFVSADRVTHPETGKSWFDTTVEVDAGALEALHPPLRLQPGMPLELYVTTSERTLFEYLARPLRGFIQRSMREPG